MDKLQIIEHKNQRVLSTQQIAESYDTSTDNITRNFNRNIDRYKDGKHYFLLEGEVLKSFRANGQIDLSPNINKFYLWTEKGALLHAKSLNTDKAWEVYEYLVDNYFKKRTSIDISSLSPELQIANQLLIAMANTEQRVKAVEDKQELITETVLAKVENWRDDVNKLFKNIVAKIGNSDFKNLRTQTYELLEKRARVDLKRRLDNLKVRMFNAGKSKTYINKLNRLDVIEEDPKLKEIYLAILKEFSIKYAS